MRLHPAKVNNDFVLDTKWKKLLYRITLLVGIVGPFGNIPQIVKIFATRDATGVSLLTWIFPVIFDIPFILWGIVRKDIPVTVTYSLWFISSSIVVIGTLIYG
jgi:uncharacterized protein with PQ loop repeat